MRRTFSSVSSLETATLTKRGFPLVKVPVLSRRASFTPAAASMTFPPRATRPEDEALDKAVA